MPVKFIKLDSPFNVTETEDCLTLTIWSPVINLDPSNLKPVLVYIHGGAFILDGSRDPRIADGEILSALGDFVVVTMRYRLGVFGCLFTNSDEAPGNLPLEDQALALEWISDNIRYFGGDPNRVTLSGESAGSISVSLHFMRPQSRPLFHQVILQSGAVRTNLNEKIDVALSRTVKLAQVVGCTVNDTIESLSNPEVLSCLRSVSPESLMTAYMDQEAESDQIQATPSCLVNKGDFSQSHADERLVAGSFPSGFPILVTSMKDEGSVILQHIMYEGPQDFREILNGTITHFTSAEAAAIIDETYYSGLLNQSNSFESQKAIVRALGDLYFRCPSIWFAEKASQTNKIWTLEYTYSSPTFSDMEPQLIFNNKFGPRHALDLVYVFGFPLMVRNKMTPEDVKQTEQIISIWKQFVHEGKLDWSPYIIQASTGQILPHQLEIDPSKQIGSTKFDDRYFYCQTWKKIIYGDKF
uniref:Carboxylic ester hydrolase n=1 Tax=Panonychus citri TaxID=50023 RepID=I1YD25_PANCT|nr:esterase 5 [Panonychus citri]